MLQAFANTARKELPPARRGVLLASIAAHLSEGHAGEAARELREYAAVESDHAMLDTVVTKTLNVLSETAHDKLPDVFAGLFEHASQPAAHLLFAKKLFDNARDITCDKALDGLLEVSHKDKALARYTVKKMDAVLCAFADARKIPDFNERVSLIGSIGLGHAANEDALKDSARHLLLEEMSKARDAASIATILRATVKNNAPDTEIDKAAAERWTTITATLPRAEKIKAALDVAEVLNKPRANHIEHGKTFATALRTIVTVAQEYSKEGRLPENVALALIGIVREGFDKTGHAAQVLKLAAAKPKFSLKNFLHI
ncbi:MAG: hypothetical protein PSY14_16155 [bacterium]|nr:hypothetical protein [bacterium]